MNKKVAIVDDHTLLSQAIAGLVADFDGFEPMYTCSNGKEFLTKLENPENLPDVVLMDINMPIMNGIETMEALKIRFPNMKVLALSIEEDENTILKMLRAGASGYLMKDTKREILYEALYQVTSCGFYHTPRVSQVLINSLQENRINTNLKDREIEFLRLACSELTYKEVADKMFLSPKTIDGYRDALHEKLGVKNRIGLVLYAIKNKIFVP